MVKLTLLQTMEDAAADTNRMKVRDMSGSFLFRGDDVEKKVKVLSEAKAKPSGVVNCCCNQSMFCWWMSPRINLDIKSECFESGTQKIWRYFHCLFVSHDRDFAGTSNLVYESKDQKIKEYSLGILNYFEQRNMENMLG
jgi:ATP-binding cassette subfamily F protein 3